MDGTRTRDPPVTGYSNQQNNHKQKSSPDELLFVLAVWTGLEPATLPLRDILPNRTTTNKKSSPDELLFVLAVWTGLEPATPCVTGRYSNQLNYHTNVI